jgi:LexA-binding, inner membrane-associated putative hydrolase
MLLFGHVGLTIGLARALCREVDVRWVAVASMLPDIIDKPLRYFITPVFTHSNTRTVGHSLTVIVVGMVVVLLLRRPIRGAGIVALVLPVHLLLDSMWASDMRISLLWPWAGNGFPPLHEVGMTGFWHHLVGNLSDPVNLTGELGGLLVLGYLWRWCGLTSAARRAQVWQTGRLVPVPKRKRLQRVPSSPSTGEG